MTYLASESSLSVVTEGQQWLLWRKKQPIFSIFEKGDTDSLTDRDSDFSKEDCNMEKTVQPMIPVIQRSQYNSVLNRFDQARKQAGSFSAWNI